ncbi:hypothetical protein D3C75_775960 [compost metagenome]
MAGERGAVEPLGLFVRACTEIIGHSQKLFGVGNQLAAVCSRQALNTQRLRRFSCACAGAGISAVLTVRRGSDVDLTGTRIPADFGLQQLGQSSRGDINLPLSSDRGIRQLYFLSE